MKGKCKCLTSFDLKLIALVTMTIDHIGAVLLPQYLFLRIIGRISFPIYCFLIVNGFFYTKNRKKYIGRLILFAFISEAFFDLAFFGNIIHIWYQNVFFTLAIGLVCISIIDMIRKNTHIKGYAFKCALELFVVLFSCITALFLRTDYSFFGIIMIYGFYTFRYRAYLLIFQMFINVVLMGGVQSFAVLSMPFIYMYNEKPGVKRFKWLFYIYYPAHLFLLYLINYSCNFHQV